MQRGSSPSSSRRRPVSVEGARLRCEAALADGYSVALVGNEITHNKLSDVAGIAKPVPEDHQMVDQARKIGISFGD